MINRREAAEKVLVRPREEEWLESDKEEEEILEERDTSLLRIAGARDQGRSAAAAAFPATIDPGMWLDMVNVKPPHVADLEMESMKKFILDYQRFSKKYRSQLQRKMQPFILELKLEVICVEDDQEYEEIVE